MFDTPFLQQLIHRIFLGFTDEFVSIATSKIAVTLDNYSKRWYNMSQGDEKNGQNAAQ